MLGTTLHDQRSNDVVHDHLAIQIHPVLVVTIKCCKGWEQWVEKKLPSLVALLQRVQKIQHLVDDLLRWLQPCEIAPHTSSGRKWLGNGGVVVVVVVVVVAVVGSTTLTLAHNK